MDIRAEMREGVKDVSEGLGELLEAHIDLEIFVGATRCLDHIHIEEGELVNILWS